MALLERPAKNKPTINLTPSPPNAPITNGETPQVEPHGNLVVPEQPGPYVLPSQEEVMADLEALCNHEGERHHRYFLRPRGRAEVEIYSRTPATVIARIFFAVPGKRDCYHVIYNGCFSQSIRESGSQLLNDFIAATR